MLTGQVMASAAPAEVASVAGSEARWHPPSARDRAQIVAIVTACFMRCSPFSCPIRAIENSRLPRLC
ncbi:MAG: hypothetical protein BGO08_05095 [Altererythrobacter sp. 66-12]|nr:MAG: hypothetical protein BGO08_05095 [Altererythrobacter sp. 66-12]